eukprot:3154474-Pyramimonas_sp.AAC.1
MAWEQRRRRVPPRGRPGHQERRAVDALAHVDRHVDRVDALVGREHRSGSNEGDEEEKEPAEEKEEEKKAKEEEKGGG